MAQRQSDSGGTPTGTPDVVRYDPSGGGSVATIVTNAASPAVSPDGKHVAWVRSDSGHQQIFVSDLNGGNVVEITSDAVEHDDPAWSGDGTTIAYDVSGAVWTVPASGGTPSLTGLSGVPAYLADNRDQVVTLAGANRFLTALAIAQYHWATADSPEPGLEVANSVVLSRSDTYADAVSGAALAAAKHGPLLMTSPTSLNSDTWTEIQRVLGSSNRSAKTVYLLGSTSAISLSTENTISSAGYKVSRLGGANRFATSIRIAQEITSSPRMVLAATGMNFPDALGAGAAAGSYDVAGQTPAVVVLTADTKLPADTKSYLDSFEVANAGRVDAALFAVGDQAATALGTRYDSFIPLAGANRYATAAAVASRLFSGGQVAGLTIGDNWPDALAGGALLGTLGGPLLLTPKSGGLNINSGYVLDVDSGSITSLLIFGDLVPSGSQASAGKWISGQSGFVTSASSSVAGTTPSTSN